MERTVKEAVDALEVCFLCDLVTEEWDYAYFAGRVDSLCRPCQEVVAKRFTIQIVKVKPRVP